MALGFKTNRVRDEYAQLLVKNPRLFYLLSELTMYVQAKYKKDVVLTSILRTPEEQADLYKNSQKKVVNSPHLTWEAVDLRSSIYTDEEIQDILVYVNGRVKNPDGKVSFVHAIPGNASHFHIYVQL